MKYSLFLLMFATVASAQGQDTSGKIAYAIAVHGGTIGAPDLLPDDLRRAKQESLKTALRIGQSILTKGGSSLDAVEQVIRHLEDDPNFNAGRGAVFNSVGGHELDASIMDGTNRACGAVAGVTSVKNPISLARLVMTETRHVLLAGQGADRFAAERKVDLVDQKYFSTDYQRRNWIEARDQDKGTVGCVALDRMGNLAAGTSTGGLTNKKFGRIGDSPIIGAGTFADNRTCAVSCTGIGEHFIRNAVAFDVSARMAYKKQSLANAVDDVIHHQLKPGYGGIIAVGRDGSIGIDFNTPGMSRASADSSGRFEVQVGK